MEEEYRNPFQLPRTEHADSTALTAELPVVISAPGEL
jgi:hypothetical protein